MNLDISTSQRKVRTEVFRLVDAGLATTATAADTDGAVIGAHLGTVKKDGSTAGLYTIVLNRPFAVAPAVVATPLHATKLMHATIVSVTTSTIVIQTVEGETAAGSVPAKTAATELHVLITGLDTQDLSYDA